MRRSRPTLVTGALLVSLCVIPGSVANADEESANAPRAVTREITAIKAELQAIKTRLAEVELDGLQGRDEMEGLRDEFAALRARLELTLRSRSSMVSPPEAKQAVTADVDATASIRTAAPLLTSAEERDVGRAEELLRIGNIAGARLVLEHVLRGGNPIVAFKLAETYDPRRLQAWRVFGVRGDAQKARELYKQAHAGGVQQAEAQLADLR
jgi:hypothetical protein